jgi:hypothetical protein
MIPKGWVQSTDKYGNDVWNPGGARGKVQGEIREVSGGAPNVADPSGVHGGDYVEIRAGGLHYRVAEEGSPAIGNPINGGAEFTPNGNRLSGNPDFAEEHPFPTTGDGDIGVP